MSSIYAKLYWLDDYEKPWRCFRKETFLVACFAWQTCVREGSIQYILFETSCKITCNFVVKLNVWQLQLKFSCSYSATQWRALLAVGPTRKFTSEETRITCQWFRRAKTAVAVLLYSQYLTSTSDQPFGWKLTCNKAVLKPSTARISTNQRDGV